MFLDNICKFVQFLFKNCSPDAHGSELVPVLSQILSQNASVEGSIASALAVQGITSLCRSGIMDISSTWRGLAPKLLHDKRPGVIVRYSLHTYQEFFKFCFIFWNSMDNFVLAFANF